MRLKHVAIIVAVTFTALGYAANVYFREWQTDELLRYAMISTAAILVLPALIMILTRFKPLAQGAGFVAAAAAVFFGFVAGARALGETIAYRWWLIWLLYPTQTKLIIGAVALCAIAWAALYITFLYQRRWPSRKPITVAQTVPVGAAASYAAPRPRPANAVSHFCNHCGMQLGRAGQCPMCVPARQATPVAAPVALSVNSFCDDCGLLLNYAGQACPSCKPQKSQPARPRQMALAGVSAMTAAPAQPIAVAATTIQPLPATSAKSRPARGVLTSKYQKLPFQSIELYVMGSIGAGAMGAVDQVFDADFRSFALKRMKFTPSEKSKHSMPLQRAEYLAAVAAFKAEAELLMRLQHPRIPRCYGVEELNGEWYMFQQFVEGQLLQSMLEQKNQDYQQFAAQEAVQWIDQILEVLEYLHTLRNEAGQPAPIIFRDVKPGNIIVGPKGAILIDFGIAVPLCITPGGVEAFGSHGYCPPEQIKGRATPSCDIYAAGSLLHQLLTLQTPPAPPVFDRTLIVRPDVTANLNAVIQKATAYESSNRFRSAIHMRAALRELTPAICA